MGLETSHWKASFSTTTSTTATKAVNLRGYSERFTAHFVAGAGSTGVIGVEIAAGSSAGPYSRGIASCTLASTGSCVVVQFAGPVEWLRGYCVSKTTGDLSIELWGN